MRRQYGHFFLAAAALLFQVLPIAFIHYVSLFAYTGSQPQTESLVWTSSMVGLAFFALSGMALACTASYLLWTRSRVIVAVPLMALCCVPAWLLSSLYLHAVLLFLAWI